MTSGKVLLMHLNIARATVPFQDGYSLATPRMPHVLLAV